ncbi:hypothetical protein M409DRAFT_57165 [Zasmidium cellare ATCC 36951]|uniref:Uncharacterized protein n=1 Tax=Zasmidium cellare ATCC 36951 TaxID=1080233 RepID=A0A6A6C9E7_ZASCE|nr:uncharacterized protein M409DRAFT_57165 [Zasmidium cellare ATCC 36951]KAF2163661.1 hypothetical protein M409DRAFT_57165 [Zasmidium cellare ATCC 36951]
MAQNSSAMTRSARGDDATSTLLATDYVRQAHAAGRHTTSLDDSRAQDNAIQAQRPRNSPDPNSEGSAVDVVEGSTVPEEGNGEGGDSEQEEVVVKDEVEGENMEDMEEEEEEIVVPVEEDDSEEESTIEVAAQPQAPPSAATAAQPAPQVAAPPGAGPAPPLPNQATFRTADVLMLEHWYDFWHRGHGTWVAGLPPLTADRQRTGVRGPNAGVWLAANRR